MLQETFPETSPEVFSLRSFTRPALRSWLALLLIVLLGLGLRVGYGAQKQSYHVDETYSYLLSATRLGEFIGLWPEPDVAGPDGMRAMQGRELIGLTRLTADRHGDYAGIIVATALDVHPPLYYLLLHEAMYLGGQSENKWIGLALNCLIYVGEALLLFLLGRRLWPGQPALALIAVLVWSMGLGAISQTLMARMYELLTLWCLLALWSGFGLMTAPAPRRRDLAWLALACLGGLLSHYFFLLVLLPLAGRPAREPDAVADAGGGTVPGIPGAYLRLLSIRRHA